MIDKNIILQLNDETRKHSERVSELCRKFAPALSLDASIAARIGLYHDIGKLYVPACIIKKNGKLSDIEREIMDLHSYYGYRILKEAGELPTVYMPVLFHHGFWKPKMDVPNTEGMDELTVRYIYLIHSVDVYDAMTNKRVYHDAFSKDTAIDILEKDVLSSLSITSLLRQYA